MSAGAIHLSSIDKSFGSTHALEAFDLDVAEGEVHGFLGPNGAGKSTAIRVILGMLRPDGGRATVLGRDPWQDAVPLHREVAYVPGDVALWPSLTGGEVIDFLTGLRGGADEALRAQLVADFDLDERKRCRSYSKGNRQKVALIAAFARPARLYVLDEPTSGLDPLMESVFRAQVQRVRAEGASVLLSSHVLSEVEQLCDRITIIRNGRTVESGTLADMRHLTRTSFRVVIADAEARAGVAAELGATAVDDETLEFEVDHDEVPATLERLAAAGTSSITAMPLTLESIFLRHYETREARA
jgi:ABC-2 type transport system ATP-binding protein